MNPLRYLLDTDICIFVQRRQSPSALQRFGALRSGEAAMSTISFGELSVGAMKTRDPRRAVAILDDFTATVSVLPLPVEAARQYGLVRAALETKGRVIGTNDLWIAAHALASDLTLVTNNEREFRRVEGLRVENWAAA